jgi:hypothetical protein
VRELLQARDPVPARALKRANRLLASFLRTIERNGRLADGLRAEVLRLGRGAQTNLQPLLPAARR